MGHGSEHWFVYVQETGAFYEVWDEGFRLMSFGYSGKGRHTNDPASQELKRLGPLPRGWYKVGVARTHPTLGPVAIPLSPEKATERYGRSDFYVHGDNMFRNRSASSGCIVINRITRDYIATKGGAFRLLVVEKPLSRPHSGDA